jgi:heme/copper-type cytochrome/quinol oxidase subunit 3
LLSSGATLHIAGLWFKFNNTNVETKSTKILLESYLLLPINIAINFYGVESKNYSKTWTFEHLTNQLITTFWITIWLVITISLGIIFTYIQSFEYIYLLPFNINDSVFGSCFYLLTGFHGLHVIIGTIFLAISLERLMLGHFTREHHFGFEAGAWYWHFVDVVWLFLFITIYWWGS